MGTVTRVDSIIHPQEVEGKKTSRIVEVLKKIWLAIKAIFRRLFSTQNGLKKLDEARIQKLAPEEIRFLSRSQLGALNLQWMTENQVQNIHEKVLIRILNSEALDRLTPQLSLKQLRVLLRNPKTDLKRLVSNLESGQIEELVRRGSTQRSTVPHRLPYLLQRLSQEQLRTLWEGKDAKSRSFCYRNFRAKDSIWDLAVNLPESEFSLFVAETGIHLEDRHFRELFGLTPDFCALGIQILCHDREKLERLCPFLTDEQVDWVAERMQHWEEEEKQTLTDLLMEDEDKKIPFAQQCERTWDAHDFAATFTKYAPLPISFKSASLVQLIDRSENITPFTEYEIRAYLCNNQIQDSGKLRVVRKVLGTDKAKAMDGLWQYVNTLDFLRQIPPLNPDEMRSFYLGYKGNPHLSLRPTDTADNLIRSLPFISNDLDVQARHFETILPVLKGTQLISLQKEKRLIKAENVLACCSKIMCENNSLCEEQLMVILRVSRDSILDVCKSIQNKPIPDTVFLEYLKGKDDFKDIFPYIERDHFHRGGTLYERVAELIHSSQVSGERLCQILQSLVSLEYLGFAELAPYIKGLSQPQKDGLILTVDQKIQEDLDAIRRYKDTLPLTQNSFTDQEIAELGEMKKALQRVESFTALLKKIKPNYKQEREIEEDLTSHVFMVVERDDGKQDMWGFLARGGLTTNQEIVTQLGIPNLRCLSELGSEIEDLAEFKLKSGIPLYEDGDAPKLVIAKLQLYFRENPPRAD